MCHVRQGRLVTVWSLKNGKSPEESPAEIVGTGLFCVDHQQDAVACAQGIQTGKYGDSRTVSAHGKFVVPGVGVA